MILKIDKGNFVDDLNSVIFVTDINRYRHFDGNIQI